MQALHLTVNTIFSGNTTSVWVELQMVTAALAAIVGVSAIGVAEQSNANSIAEDIKKFKELLEGGIIIQEEFNAKKKQLLGI